MQAFVNEPLLTTSASVFLHEIPRSKQEMQHTIKLFKKTVLYCLFW